MAPLNWDNIEIIAEDESIVRITDWSRVEIVSEDGDLIKTCDNDVYNIEACDRMIVFSGQPGAAATIRVGTVTTLPAGSDATVTNSGTPEDAIFDFGIPEGADGASEWGDIGGTLSDQTDLQNALNAKANSADLGDLATKDSVNYETEVTNKPTLGTMSAESASDYYDKTDTDALLNEKADIIHASASGSLVSISDGAPYPVIALTVDIEPVQDLHGYDHPWAGGAGTNIMPTITKGTYTGGGLIVVVGDNNFITVSGTKNTNDAVFIELPYEVSGQYFLQSYWMHIRNDYSNSSIRFYWKNTESGYIALTSDNRIVQRTSESSLCETAGIRVSNAVTSGTELNFTLQPSIEATDSVTDWTPYSNVCPISGHTACNIYLEDEYDEQATPTVTIDLGGTRYGGTLNVLTGEMTVDRAYKTYTGNDVNSYGYNSTYNTNYVILSLSPSAITTDDIVLTNLCDRYKFVLGNSYHFGARITSQSALRFYDDRFTNEATAKSILTTETPSICYYLATPFTVQLESNTMSLLLGDNNIWADTGDTSVMYKADTKLYIERLTKPTEDDMVANTNIASGKYFMVGNNLYLSTSAIASGTTIVPGSNCTALSLADALNNLNA